MSEVLTLASDFIDKMSNPSYGIHVNEDYSLRFAKLIENNEFVGPLVTEIRRLRDVNTFSPYGWLWILNWARSKRINLNSTLLLDLTEKWSSISMQALVIEVATQGADLGDRKYSTSLD